MAGEDKGLKFENGQMKSFTFSDNTRAFTNVSGVVSVGDVVAQSTLTDNRVVLADADNANARPPIGIVIEVVDTTNCIVASNGAVATGMLGLTRSSVYWLSTIAGATTTTRPTSNAYMVGVATSTTEMLILVDADDASAGGVQSSGGTNQFALARWSDTTGGLLDDGTSLRSVFLNPSGHLYPEVSTQNLGTVSDPWNTLYMASTGVLNFGNGDVKLTSSTNLMTFSGANNGWRFDNHVMPSAGGPKLGDGANARNWLGVESGNAGLTLWASSTKYYSIYREGASPNELTIRRESATGTGNLVISSVTGSWTVEPKGNINLGDGNIQFAKLHLRQGLPTTNGIFFGNGIGGSWFYSKNDANKAIQFDGSGSLGPILQPVTDNDGRLGLTTNRWALIESVRSRTGRVVITGTMGFNLKAVDVDSVCENTGALNQNYWFLPTADTNGMRFTFINMDATFPLRFKAATGDTIRIGGSVSSTNRDCTSAAVGDAIVVQCINATEWVAVSTIGTWTLS